MSHTFRNLTQTEADALVVEINGAIEPRATAHWEGFMNCIMVTRADTQATMTIGPGSNVGGDASEETWSGQIDEAYPPDAPQDPRAGQGIDTYVPDLAPLSLVAQGIATVVLQWLDAWHWGEDAPAASREEIEQAIAGTLVDRLGDMDADTVIGPDGKTYNIRVTVTLEPAE